MPSKRQLNADANMPSDMAYRKAFGSWGNALRECGIEPPKPYPSKKCMTNMINAHKGKRSFAWKGGRLITKQGYVQIWKPEHPNASKKGYVFEHRMIMAEHIDRPLFSNENVHHVNGNKQDNRIENLKIMSIGDHVSIHNKGIKKNKAYLYQCTYPKCTDMTNSKYELCHKHYKLQWQRIKTGSISDFHDFSREYEVIGNIHEGVKKDGD